MANIPQPITYSGGPAPHPLQQLLLALAQGLGTTGIETLAQHIGATHAPPTAAEQQLSGQQQGDLATLVGMSRADPASMPQPSGAAPLPTQAMAVLGQMGGVAARQGPVTQASLAAMAPSALVPLQAQQTAATTTAEEGVRRQTEANIAQDTATKTRNQRLADATRTSADLPPDLRRTYIAIQTSPDPAAAMEFYKRQLPPTEAEILGNKHTEQEIKTSLSAQHLNEAEIKRVMAEMDLSKPDTVYYGVLREMLGQKVMNKDYQLVAAHDPNEAQTLALAAARSAGGATWAPGPEGKQFPTVVSQLQDRITQLRDQKIAGPAAHKLLQDEYARAYPNLAANDATSFDSAWEIAMKRLGVGSASK